MFVRPILKGVFVPETSNLWLRINKRRDSYKEFLVFLPINAARDLTVSSPQSFPP